MLHSRVRLRQAELGDALPLWEWRNEEGMRQASFQSAPVPLADHEAWLARVVTDPSIRLLVASDESGHDIGYIRFNILDQARQAEVSVCLDRRQRRRGLGAALIAAGCESLWAERPELEVVALVKEQNAASRAAFEAAGFLAIGTRSRDDHVVHELRRRLVRDQVREA